jgi:hypothetical protein
MKIPEQPVVSLPTVDEGEILLLPVTALYDRGSLIIETGLLDQRRTQPFLCMHPKTAQGLGLQEGNPYCFYLSKIRYLITLKLDESLPIGVGFVARSLGLPLTAPAVIKPEKSD